jgi:chromosome segregation ATPase
MTAPAPDLDALIESRPFLSIAFDPTGSISDWMAQAAAAITELRAENARLKHPTAADEAIAAGDGTLHGAIDYWQQRAERAERAEQEVARLASELRLMAVGMKAHQEGNKQATDRAARAEAEVARLKELHRLGWASTICPVCDEVITKQAPDARIAALEAERDALKAERADLIKINNKWAQEWDQMREERDANAKDAERYMWLRRYHARELLEIAWQYPAATSVGADCDAAIDAARSKP